MSINKDDLPNTADSIPGGAIFADIALIGIAWRILVSCSNVALPSKKKTLSGMPIATFHRMTMIRSTIVARDPTTIENTRAGRYRQELMKVWYNITAIR